MANQNFEKLLEYIVNGEQEKAEELFHALVVGKSREIYEGLFEEEMKDVDMDEAKDCEDEEEMEEAKEEEEEAVEEAFIAFSEEPGMGAVGGDPTDDMIGDVGADDDAGDEFGGDMDDMGGDEDEMGGEGDIEDRVMDLEDALEDLKAEFEALMADEEGEPEHNDGENDPDFGGDDEEGSDDFGGEEEEGEEEEETDESFNFEDIEDIDLSPTEQMREYVEKVTKGVLGSSEEAGVHKKSPVAGKNDMGGTTENMMRSDQGSTKGTAGGLLNPSTKEDNAGNVNVPGGKAGVKHLKNVPAGHGAEKKGSGDSAPNKKSIIGSKG